MFQCKLCFDSFVLWVLQSTDIQSTNLEGRTRGTGEQRALIGIGLVDSMTGTQVVLYEGIISIAKHCPKCA